MPYGFHDLLLDERVLGGRCPGELDEVGLELWARAGNQVIDGQVMDGTHCSRGVCYGFGALR